MIDVCLYNGLPLFDPLSVGRQRVLNPEILQYIDGRAAIIPASMPLTVRFHHSGLTEQDRSAIRACLQEHYTVILHEKQRSKRSNRRKLILLGGLGLAILSIYLTLTIANSDSLRTELLSIIASFSLWEATDLFLLERNEIRKDIWETARHLSQNIEFLDDASASP